MVREKTMNEEYMEPIEFLVKYWPENPNKLTAKGIKVPLIYLGDWLSTYGCNNWRKLHNMPMWRKKLQYKLN